MAMAKGEDQSVSVTVAAGIDPVTVILNRTVGLSVPHTANYTTLTLIVDVI